ncbi:cupin domain-containing protein [Clostridium sp. CX1]|nr:cupin domain-containing protein [Clostridium sp. CX1]MCT8978491.1 cupin domain-containing protein [Clostridium sp. CX1]
MIYVNNSYNPCPCSYCMEYPCPYWVNTPRYNSDFSDQFTDQYPPFTDEMEYEPTSDFSEPLRDNRLIQLKDYGPEPFVVNIDEATKQNNAYRTALWTGKHLQLTLMSIKPGEDIGLEIHPNLDQFIRIEEGQGIVKMGNRKDKLDFQQKVYDDFAFIIPAGTWHNLINTGNKPIKLYSIYAPPQHPRGTVQKTKAAAQAAEEKHNR